jgi:hypothetical protein
MDKKFESEHRIQVIFTININPKYNIMKWAVTISLVIKSALHIKNYN